MADKQSCRRDFTLPVLLANAPSQRLLLWAKSGAAAIESMFTLAGKITKTKDDCACWHSCSQVDTYSAIKRRPLAVAVAADDARAVAAPPFAIAFACSNKTS